MKSESLNPGLGLGRDGTRSETNGTARLLIRGSRDNERPLIVPKVVFLSPCFALLLSGDLLMLGVLISWVESVS